jgi:GxxExxY protein
MSFIIPAETDLNEITEGIIGCAYIVQNELGAGFLEKVYENALAVELSKAGWLVDQQHGISVKYSGEVVGEYIADLLVQKRVIVELKAVKNLDEAHFAQALNYLKATGLEVCLVLNFGNPRIEIKRFRNKREWEKK